MIYISVPYGPGLVKFSPQGPPKGNADIKVLYADHLKTLCVCVVGLDASVLKRAPLNVEHWLPALILF